MCWERWIASREAMARRPKKIFKPRPALVHAIAFSWPTLPWPQPLPLACQWFWAYSSILMHICSSICEQHRQTVRFPKTHRFCQTSGTQRVTHLLSWRALHSDKGSQPFLKAGCQDVEAIQSLPFHKRACSIVEEADTQKGSRPSWKPSRLLLCRTLSSHHQMSLYQPQNQTNLGSRAEHGIL